jgi:predicted nuclease of restriction endonuclease-like (RecB) superfamily
MSVKYEAKKSTKLPEIGFWLRTGFSAANLWRTKQFYEAYANDEKLAPLVREVSWTKNLVILERCKQTDEREFYLRSTKQFGWTKNVLIHQIDNETFKKTLLNQTNFETTLPEHIRNQAKLAVKDEYTFDFLELADEHSERQLEQALLAKVEPSFWKGRAFFFHRQPISPGDCRQRVFHRSDVVSSPASFPCGR